MTRWPSTSVAQQSFRPWTERSRRSGGDAERERQEKAHAAWPGGTREQRQIASDVPTRAAIGCSPLVARRHLDLLVLWFHHDAGLGSLVAPCRGALDLADRHS